MLASEAEDGGGVVKAEYRIAIHAISTGSLYTVTQSLAHQDMYSP
jgi:hypothetical protein